MTTEVLIAECLIAAAAAGLILSPAAGAPGRFARRGVLQAKILGNKLRIFQTQIGYRLFCLRSNFKMLRVNLVCDLRLLRINIPSRLCRCVPGCLRRSLRIALFEFRLRRYKGAVTRRLRLKADFERRYPFDVLRDSLVDGGCLVSGIDEVGFKARNSEPLGDEIVDSVDEVGCKHSEGGRA